ncbi:CFI-box-CTERM domain-containing protein [Alkalilacustris brevis]|uniref:CFI-box-CTERM domain-containing protein n=1 Tax=Alkalilacustris brevis TaxID=2026338 RepID=UPI000E0D9CFF|nr:CFI-box-CTERM domain-containing protein [Alkalilacustris brevis]
MGEYTITLGPVNYAGTTVTSDHFGTNVVFTRDYLDYGGPFDRIFDLLSFGAIRFPGGTFTEEAFSPGGPAAERLFDIYRPSGLLGDSDTGGIEDDEARIVTAPAAFEYANTKDVPFNFVLPTENYLSDTVGDDGYRTPEPFGLYRLIDRVDDMIRGDYGDIEIDMFVIGNEFWYRDERMSATEYGRIVDDLSVGLQTVFDLYRAELDDPDAWTEPKIAAQVSQGWRPEDNQAILAELGPEARAAVDVVVTHFYPRYYQHVANSRGQFDRLDDWQNAEGFGDLEYYVSEWNTSLEQDSDAGLMQASTMLEVTRTMLLRDVDHASIWGVQYQNLKNRLSELDRGHDEVSGGDYRLTPAGELFRMMNPSLQGLRVLDTDTPDALRSDLLTPPEDREPDNRDQLVMHAFGSDERAVIFLSSRTDTPMTVTLDHEGLIPEYSHVWAQKLGVLDDPATTRDEGDPTEPFARPYLTSYMEDAMGDGEGFTIELDAYEIVRFEFTIADDIGVHLYGHDQVVDPAASYDDTLIGAAGDDLIEGHYGDNLLMGMAGNDIIIGGAGNDTIDGGEGDDLLFSGEGNNEMHGGPGNDTLIADGGGANILTGGEGTNHFAVSVEGDVTITDFRPDEGQSLSFLRHYESSKEVMERATIDGDDIIILHDEGTTELLGAAAHFDDLEAALADHMEESPLDALLDVFLAEPPDGSIAPDPEPPEDYESLREIKLELARMLNSHSEEGLQAFLDEQDEETLVALAELINPAILTFTTTSIFDVFLNSLPEESVDHYFARLPAELLGQQLMRFEEALPSDVLDLSPYVLEKFLDKLTDEDGAAWLSRMDQDDQGALLSRMDEAELDPENWAWFSTFDAPPEPEEDEEEDFDGGGGGGGCFVATCAYGGRAHPDVAFLRCWRDLVLAEYAAGRAFIRVYYRVGPRLARALAPCSRARALMRALLGGVVRLLGHAHGLRGR